MVIRAVYHRRAHYHPHRATGLFYHAWYKLFSSPASCLSPCWTDLPTNTPPSFLFKEHELALARRRMESVGRRPPTVITKKKVSKQELDREVF
jgi:hypothetical protein